jgi:hypothetical protein
MGKRQCLFCPNSANSKEHIWAKWILQSLKHVSSIQHSIGKATPKTVSSNLTMKCVCDTCNRGWMSALEVENKATIGPLMHDFSLRVDEQQQHAIARWVTKTAMVVEATTARHRTLFYSPDECKQLRLNSVIPPRTAVWIGRYSGSSIGALGTDIWLNLPGEPKATNGSVTTLVLGHLVLQVLTFHVSPEYRDGTVTVGPKIGPWEDLLLSTWPATGPVVWPPSLSFGRSGVLSIRTLIDRFKIGNIV